MEIKENMNLLMEGIVLQATMDYVKCGRIVKKGTKVKGYHASEREFESAKRFFNGSFFYSFINGNSDAQVAFINKMNRLVDLPQKITVEEAIFDMISNKKRAQEVSSNENYKKKFLEALSSEAQVKLSKTGLIKVDAFYLNYRCKMLAKEIEDCFI